MLLKLRLLKANLLWIVFLTGPWQQGFYSILVLFLFEFNLMSGNFKKETTSNQIDSKFKLCTLVNILLDLRFLLKSEVKNRLAFVINENVLEWNLCTCFIELHLAHWNIIQTKEAGLYARFYYKPSFQSFSNRDIYGIILN